MKSYSNETGDFSVWMRDNLKLLRVLATSGCNIRDSESKLQRCSEIYSNHSQKNLKDCKILEIGFGAKRMQLAFNSSKCEEFVVIDNDFFIA